MFENNCFSKKNICSKFLQEGAFLRVLYIINNPINLECLYSAIDFNLYSALLSVKILLRTWHLQHFFMSTLQCSAQVSSVQHAGRQKLRNDRLVTPAHPL